MASSGSQSTSPLWCPVSIVSWNSEMRGFGFYCNTQNRMRSKPRGWRGNGTLCRLWITGESQPCCERCFKDVAWDSSWFNCNFTPLTNLAPKRERWAGKWVINCSSCHGLRSGQFYHWSVCVLPNQDSHMTHRTDGQSEIWHSATPLMCPFEIPLKPTVWSEFLNIFHAICTAQRTSLMMPFSFSSIYQKRRADPDVNLCQSWWGYPSVCLLGIWVEGSRCPVLYGLSMHTHIQHYGLKSAATA